MMSFTVSRYNPSSPLSTEGYNTTSIIPCEPRNGYVMVKNAHLHPSGDDYENSVKLDNDGPRINWIFNDKQSQTIIKT